MVKLLVDEDMPRPTADLLKSLGFSSFDVRDIGLKGATDSEVFKYAQEKGMIILSRDKEFGNLLKYPLGNHCGIIIVRLPHDFIRNQILLSIKNFFCDIERNKLPSNLTIVEVGKYRIKRGA